MAISKGKVSVETASQKYYVGVGSVFVKAICPDMKTLNSIYDRDVVTEEPSYVSTIDINGESVEMARIEWVLQTDPTRNNDIEKTVRASFILRNQPRKNADGTKLQVVDQYGRFAWVTTEQFANKEIPTYTKDGIEHPFNITNDYRAAYVGEEALTEALKVYLNIPNVMDYKNGEWVMTAHPEDCTARLEKVADYFKGDFSELQEVLSYQPTNKMKVAFGVRTTEDNDQYQTVYTNKVLRCGVSKYTKLYDDIKDAQERASESSNIKNTQFFVDGTLTNLQEYVNTPTKVEPTTQEVPSSWLVK